MYFFFPHMFVSSFPMVFFAYVRNTGFGVSRESSRKKERGRFRDSTKEKGEEMS